MRSVKSITLKKTNTLYCLWPAFLVLFLFSFQPVFSQDNSPYSRYGIGDLVPPTNIMNRGMGGISAAYSDMLSINFNNPASYSQFEVQQEKRSKKVSSGRAILDIGLNFDNRSLKDQNIDGRFTASNALFSYVQVGVPLKKNWGLVFGIRPISRISYKMFRNEWLINPIAPFDTIENSTTLFEGDGGAYLASAGTGLAVFQRMKKGLEEKLSLGINGGYFFGKKNYSTRRTLFNDSIEYKQANYETKTTYGGLYANAGIQYRLPVNEKKKMMLMVGAYGSWSHNLNARRDVLRETYVYDLNFGNIRLDSVSDTKDVKGKLILPSTYTIGFALQKFPVRGQDQQSGFIVGMDFQWQNWDQYRLYGEKDSVRNKWELKLGTEFNPIPTRNYFSNVAYRFGLSMGPDYIKVGQKLSQFGASLGLGLPLVNKGRQSNQYTLINLSFEYLKRGNNNNLLSENMFRVSVGFSLSDVWFFKRRYD